MKRTNILYWVFTGLFAALMLFSSIPDILSQKEAVDMFNKMGMPLYLLPFLGWAKTFGVVAILVPGFPRLKEWAYAGLMIDLIGASYSIYMTNPSVDVLFMLIFILMGFASYYFYHKKYSPITL